MPPPSTLPIDAVLPEVLASLRGHPRLVLEAPPGAGKTTRLPPALLGEAWRGDGRILMLEPRRIAARAAATFMAAERGEEVGATIGYRIRFESNVSAATRIEVVTEGILTRMIQDAPELPGVAAILFDEFHERHLHGDLGAALALDVQANLRPDLRLVVMSATLSGERVARWFDAPRIASGGRSFPVRIVHPPLRPDEAWPERGWSRAARRAIDAALAENDGDVLVFLPGKREIDQMSRLLAGSGADDGARESATPMPTPTARVVPLHGELPLEQQRAALAPSRDGERRIVLATNVAESSLTLPGIRAVVDLGLAREPRFDPNSGFTRLDTVLVSQASADQRAGRAGRLAAGACYRLWPQSRRLDADRTPEIASVELSRLALEAAAWGSAALHWLDAPPAGALAQARELLQRLGALTADGRITALGRDMLAFGAEPRLAAAVMRASPHAAALACDAVALVEARSPLRGEAARDDDFRSRHAALVAWRERRVLPEVDRSVLAAIAEAANAWRRRRGIAASADAAPHGATALGDVLAHAFPDRIARQDPGDPRRYRLANGRGARLGERSALFGEPWLVVVDLRHEARDSLIFSAAPIDPQKLAVEFPDRYGEARVARWNRDKAAVEAWLEQRFDGIVLERRSVPVTPEDAVPALLAAVRETGLDALPWSETADGLRQRVVAARAWLPEAGFPDFSDAALLATLEEWLAPMLAGKRRLDALSAAELSQALSARLTHAQRKTLDAEVPVALRVPSGMERRLDYGVAETPVLAVKLQELFGLADTPRIAGGRVPLTLHLLSPGGRPIQVTQDLRGFWDRTYADVKKELKGRYLKHPWPDDPWTATPTHRAKPRR